MFYFIVILKDEKNLELLRQHFRVLELKEEQIRIYIQVAVVCVYEKGRCNITYDGYLKTADVCKLWMARARPHLTQPVLGREFNGSRLHTPDS